MLKNYRFFICLGFASFMSGSTINSSPLLLKIGNNNHVYRISSCGTWHEKSKNRWFIRKPYWSTKCYHSRSIINIWAHIEKISLKHVRVPSCWSYFLFWFLRMLQKCGSMCHLSWGGRKKLKNLLLLLLLLSFLQPSIQLC